MAGDLRFVFCGSSDFARACLEGLLDAGAALVGIVGYDGGEEPPRDYWDPTGHPAVTGLPCLRTGDLNGAEAASFLEGLAPDFVFASWPRLLRKHVLDVPRYGTIGSHWSLLPANRGRHPLHWALALGLDKTGLTFFRMDEGVDSGPIVLRRGIPIHEHDSIADLHRKLNEIAHEAVRDLLQLLERDPLHGRPQDASHANTWRKRTPDDIRIDLRMTAKAIYDLVRSYSHPYPGAVLAHDGVDYRIFRTEVIPDVPANHEPGLVTRIEPAALVVKAGAGAIRIFAEDFPPATSLTEGSYIG